MVYWALIYTSCKWKIILTSEKNIIATSSAELFSIIIIIIIIFDIYIAPFNKTWSKALTFSWPGKQYSFASAGTVKQMGF